MFRPIESAAPSAPAFVPVARGPSSPHKAERTDARKLHVFRASDGFEVALPEELVERFRTLSRVAAPNEWHGKLAGRLLEDEQGVHVVLVGVVPDEHAIATPGSVETTHESEAEATSLLRRLFLDAIEVGWCHGHVRCGARFSETDRETQRSWKARHSVAIVVDPWSRPDLAVYRGSESELLVRVESEPVKADKPRLMPGLRTRQGVRCVPPSSMKRDGSWGARLRWGLLGLLFAVLGGASFTALHDAQAAGGEAREARRECDELAAMIAERTAPCTPSVTNEPDEPEVCIAP